MNRLLNPLLLSLMATTLVSSCSDSTFSGAVPGFSSGSSNTPSSRGPGQPSTGGETPDNPYANPQLSQEGGWVACAESAQQTLTKTITFPARSGCAWGQNGNDPYLPGTNEGRLSARSEEIQQVEVPAGGKVCEVTVNSQNTTFRYDDHIMLSMNGVVVVTNFQRLTSQMTVTNNKYARYDWTKIRGIRWSNSSEWVDYCLSSTTCVIPDSEQTGALQFGLSTVDATTIQLINPTSLDFMLTTMGDEEQTDCQHMNMSLDVTLKYVTQ